MSQKDEDAYKDMWALKTENMIENFSWYWWWWIFFVKDPENPGRPKQFMILWSTKYTDYIKVMDKEWSVDRLPKWDGNELRFNGMTAAWWYDGEKMYDPLILRSSDFIVKNGEEKGFLKPKLKDAKYTISGSPEKYTVKVKDPDNDFEFNMTPWNDYLQKHRFNEKRYTKKYGYNILKIQGMKLNGEIDGEEIEGSAYFQRVCVDAPAVPWYWAVVHSEDGSYIQYMIPFIGPQIFRSKKKSKSKLDWGDIGLSRNITFYHRGTDKEYVFKSKSVKIDHEIVDGLPVFEVRGGDDEKEFYLKLKAYSRAYWRFQQKRRFGMKSILYYNEYPAEVVDFRFKSKGGSLDLKQGDLGQMYGNFEHAWGKLF